MNNRCIGKAIALLLALTLGAGMLLGCKTQQQEETLEPEPTESSEPTLPEVDLGAYVLERNGSKNYPYVVRTPHATWYLSAADIELLGEEAFFDGLKTILKNPEDDFADAYAVLDGYLKDEIPVIDVHTDFAAQTERAKWNKASAYYLPEMGIYLYYGWDMAGFSLLHEYSHYLTYKCCTFDLTPGGGFWAEAVAEYVSKISCRNRMASSVASSLGDEDLAEAEKRGLMNADGTLDLKKYYCYMAAFLSSGVPIVVTYNAVSETLISLSERLVEHPMLTTISYFEAASFFTWLVERYGRELVFGSMTIGQEGFPEVFGKDFETLFFEWAADNDAWCIENGIVLGPLED